MSNNKKTQVVDFSNPNDDKIISASTQPTISNNKQSSSVESLMEIDKSRLITIEEWQKAYDNYNPEKYYNETFVGKKNPIKLEKSSFTKKIVTDYLK